MKSYQWKITFLTILISFQLHGQDTISIYFEFGHSKVSNNELEKLNNIASNYDFSDFDSIHFIGMTDSVGNLKANIKLSEKRARNVYKNWLQLFSKKIPSRITALGERTSLSKDKNRRVDIVLHLKPIQLYEEETFIDTKSEACYNIDYKLLNNSNLKIVYKRKKKLISIETETSNLEELKQHYYGSLSNNQKFVAKRIKWQSKRIGKLWWSKTRYVATIPEEDFKYYKIFKITDFPCDSCSEKFTNQKLIYKEDTCIQADQFLMENSQFYTSFFNRKHVKIRSPREFINLDNKYYIGCEVKNELIWKTKRGRKKKNYYYSKVPRSFNSIANITRVMNCCKNNHEPSNCDKPIIFLEKLSVPDKAFILNVELGSYYQNSIITPYAGLGISKEGLKSRLSIITATDDQLSFYSSLRYQYHFLSFPLDVLNPFSSWQSPTSKKIINRYGRIYLGTDLNIRLNENIQDYAGQNIHIGFTYVNAFKEVFIPRIFIQYGIGSNYLETNTKMLHSTIQVGVNMKITSLSKQ